MSENIWNKRLLCGISTRRQGELPCEKKVWHFEITKKALVEYIFYTKKLSTMVMMSFYAESDPHRTPDNSGGSTTVGNGGNGHDKPGREDDGFPVLSVWRMSFILDNLSNLDWILFPFLYFLQFKHIILFYRKGKRLKVISFCCATFVFFLKSANAKLLPVISSRISKNIKLFLCISLTLSSTLTVLSSSLWYSTYWKKSQEYYYDDFVP